MSRTRPLALLLALVGYWLPWLTHPAAALRLNGYELSEWVTFLPAVRDGSSPLTRLVFLLPLAALALLCGLAAARPATTLSLPPLGDGPARRPAATPRARRPRLGPACGRCCPTWPGRWAGCSWRWGCSAP